MTVKAKIVSFAVMASLFLLMISGGALYGLGEVGTKLKSIAEEDIPLTSLVTEITVHQLEQVVSFEQAIYYGAKAYSARATGYSTGVANTGSSVGQQSKYLNLYKKSKEKFKAFAKKVDGEIIKGEELAQHVIDRVSRAGGDPKVVDEFQMVLEILKDIEHKHSVFDKHVYEVFRLVESGQANNIDSQVSKIEQEAEKLDHDLKSLMHEIASFTANAVVAVESLEVQIQKVLAVAVVIALIIFIVLALRIYSAVIPPLLKTKAFAEDLASGNYDAETPQFNEKDEIGSALKSLATFKEQAQKMQKLEAEQVRLKKEAEEEQRALLNKMADGFDQSVGTVMAAVKESVDSIRSSSENIQRSAQETSSQSQAISSAAAQASGSTQSVSAAAEEMATANQEIVEQVVKTSQVVKGGVVKSDSAQEKVTTLQTGANKISEIVSIISDIAEQTNLLALNATIEAARAGEAGKGFAVVASEVKQLASQTADATSEITEQIQTIVTQVGESATSINDLNEVMKEIDGYASGISAAAEEQNAATQEVTGRIQETSQGVGEVSENIKAVSAQSEENSSLAQQLLTVTQDLQVKFDELQRESTDFVATVRAAVDSDPSEKPDSSDEVSLDDATVQANDDGLQGEHREAS